MKSLLNSFQTFMISRLFGFSGNMPETERIQESILNLLQDRNEITPDMMIELIYTNHPYDRMLPEILQAAQILVNKGMIRAFEITDSKITQYKTCDPVYGDGSLILTLNPQPAIQ